MTKIKAIVFDMDGVLIDAKEWHYEALNRALALFGYAISRHDHLVTYDGLPTGKKLEMLSKDRNFPRCLHGFVNEMKQQYTLDLIEARCRPRFDHQFALSRLKRDGYRVGLASNSIRKTIDRMMERAHLQQYLDVVLSNQDVVRPKPYPDIYQSAVKELGVEPVQCVVVEDNHHGIEAARTAGAYVLAVKSVDEVTYERIREFVEQIEQASNVPQIYRRAA